VNTSLIDLFVFPEVDLVKGSFEFGKLFFFLFLSLLILFICWFLFFGGFIIVFFLSILSLICLLVFFGSFILLRWFTCCLGFFHLLSWFCNYWFHFGIGNGIRVKRFEVFIVLPDLILDSVVFFDEEFSQTMPISFFPHTDVLITIWPLHDSEAMLSIFYPLTIIPLAIAPNLLTFAMLKSISELACVDLARRPGHFASTSPFFDYKLTFVSVTVRPHVITPTVLYIVDVQSMVVSTTNELELTVA
jgi:hypothetical protein